MNFKAIVEIEVTLKDLIRDCQDKEGKAIVYDI